MLPQTKVFVGSLPQGSKPEELRKLFERFGVVTECDIMNRCGFVHMETEDQATEAIRVLHNTTFNGGVISVERGRIKERGQRGGGGGGGRGGRGGMRDRRGGGGGPMRGGGGHMGGRDAPYGRGGGRGSMGGSMGGRPVGMGLRSGGMGVRNGMGPSPGYDRPSGGYDSYDGYGMEDRRGFALMDGRGGARDPYAPPMYDDRRGYAPVDPVPPPMYDDRRPAGNVYGEDDRRRVGAVAPMGGAYDRVPARIPTHMGNGDMYSRRDMPMRGAPAPAAGYDRDPYEQQYAQVPMARGSGGAPRGGGMGARRY